MTTEAQIQGLGTFANFGFTLEHLDDHVVILLHKGELVGRFSQIGSQREKPSKGVCSSLGKVPWNGCLWTRKEADHAGQGNREISKEVIKMDFGKGVVFILTREDIVNLARESDIPEEGVGDQFLKEIKDGVNSLVRTQVKKFMREIKR